VTSFVYQAPLRTKKLILIPVAIFAVACATVSTSTTKLDPSLSLARTCPVGVKLYIEADRVPRPYTEVAILRSTGEVKYSDEEGLFDSMRESAAKIGANGIILEGIDEPDAITEVAAEVANTGTERKGRAVAVYVPSESASSAAACANYKAPSWLHRHLLNHTL
jgi:hypothetical protein